MMSRRVPDRLSCSFNFKSQDPTINMSATTSSELTPPAITEALPRPIPYVCGYVFTEEQVRLFAEQVLPAEELTMARKDGGYQKRLVFYYRKQKILPTFFTFFTDDKSVALPLGCVVSCRRTTGHHARVFL
ncbi:hypothetical protein MPER_03504 [Moniliophthora perniciosa FA553]|nr:hypothetical protein MPER_03504 [Moniliophthora perniciosa FA553]